MCIISINSSAVLYNHKAQLTLKLVAHILLDQSKNLLQNVAIC